jgi:hypothetical protein
MNNELQDLYKYLKLNYEPLVENDLSINEPNKDESTEYICCDQKIITLKDGYFNICDLYDVHPCVRFGSNEEVLAFYEGCIEGMHFYFDDAVETAKAIGKIFSTHQVLKDKETETAVQKAVSPIQISYNKQEENEN